MIAILDSHSRHSPAKGKAEPEPLHNGIFWDKAARQYATRIGYRLNEANGQRTRAHVQRLGEDPDLGPSSNMLAFIESGRILKNDGIESGKVFAKACRKTTVRARTFPSR